MNIFNLINKAANGITYMKGGDCGDGISGGMIASQRQHWSDPIFKELNKQQQEQEEKDNPEDEK